MKRYSFIVTLHILSLCLLSVGIWLLAARQLWFSALMVLLVLVVSEGQRGANRYGPDHNLPHT